MEKLQSYYSYIVFVLILLCGSLVGQSSVLQRRSNSELEQDLFVEKHLGDSCLMNQQLDSALLHYQRSITNYNPKMSDKAKFNYVATLNNIGYLYYFKYNNYYLSVDALLEAQELATEIGNNELLICIYLNLGNVYPNFGDYDAAIDLYKQALQLAVQVKENDNLDPGALSLLWQNALTAYCNLLNIVHSDKSRTQELNEAIDLFNKLNVPLDAPISAYARCVTKALQIDPNTDVEKRIYWFTMAKDSLKDTYTPKRKEMLIDGMIAETWYQHGDPMKAIEIIKNIATQADKEDYIELKTSALDNLSDYYKAIGMPDSSAKYRLLMHEITDSIFTARDFAALQEIKSAYEVKRINTQVQLLKQQRERQLMLLIFLLTIVVVLAASAIIIVRKNRRLRQSNEQLFDRINAEIERHNEKSKSKYEASPLDDSEKQCLAKKIDELRNSDEIFNQGFSLDRMSELLQEKPHYVSQVLNEVSGKPFSTWLAEARVERACALLGNPENKVLTIEAIANMTGFKSRTNFTAVFKKTTGLTPSEYHRIAMSKAQ